MNVLVGIQARSDSKRFPDKIFKKIDGVPMLKRVVESAEEVSVLNKVLSVQVSVLHPEGDEKVMDFCATHKIECYGGHPDDLILRYLQAAEYYNTGMIIRLTGDCPMIPTDVIEHAITVLSEVDYVANTVFRSYPEGMDIQGVGIDALEWFDDNQKREREHPFVMFDQNALVREEFIEAGFQWKPLLNLSNPIFQKLSIDTEEDMAKVEGYARART